MAGVEPLSAAAENLVRRLAITPDALRRGCEEYRRREPRDSMYNVAQFLLGEGVWWGNPARMADALAVLLLSWNGAYYRYGSLDAASVEACLRENWNVIQAFHERDIESLDDGDRETVLDLFGSMLGATRRHSEGGNDPASPVSVAKALHLLAPQCLPIWDDRIAAKYGCRYGQGRDPAKAYWDFCRKTRELARPLRGRAPDSSKSLLKQIDEYNYACYSKHWLDC